MNIQEKKNKLLTIDDPSVYHEFDEQVFLHAEICDSFEHVGTDTSKLYLVETDTTGQYLPYVRGENGEKVQLINPFSRGQTLPHPQLNGSNDLKMKQLNENLVAIDNHLYALRKELSYWNLYQIGYSVEKADAFSSTMSVLSPGEALIINVDGQFEYEGQTYTRGDLVVRLTDGTYTTITSSLSGFYYPSHISKQNKVYTITYRYHHEGKARQGSIEIPEDTEPELEEPYETETFKVDSADPDKSFIYGQKYDVSEVTSQDFDVYHYGDENKVIPPIIKFFTEDGEEIWLDFTCVIENPESEHPQYKVTFTNKPNNLKWLYVK